MMHLTVVAYYAGRTAFDGERRVLFGMGANKNR